MDISEDLTDPEKTILVTRGVCRLLNDMGQAPLTELTLINNRRVDIIALDKAGKVTIVEVKVSTGDFKGDQKWQEYLPFCDAFYFAVPVDFPEELLPSDHGIIKADAYGAAILSPATEGTMNPARRKALTLRFARQASSRLIKPVIDGVL